MLKKIFFLAAVMGLALLYAASRIQIVEMGYEVSRRQAKVTEMRRTNKLLKSKLALAKATSRLDIWSRELRMTLPSLPQILWVEE